MKKQLSSKVGVFGDLHLTNGLPYTVPGDFTRKEKLLSFLEKAFDKMVNEKVDLILFAGDICHKTFLDGTDLDLLVAFLMKLRFTKIPAVMISGNHDQDHKNHILEFLAKNKQFSKNLSFSLENGVSISGRSHRVVALNYFQRDKDFIKEATDGMLSKKERGSFYNILLAHVGIKGTLHGTTKSILGVKKEDVEALSKGYDLMVFGHHHKFQAVASNGFYSGAIQQTRIDEIGTIPGALIVDFPSLKVEKIINEESPRFTLVEDYIFYPKNIFGNIIKPVLDLEHKSKMENESFLQEILSYKPYYLIRPRMEKRTEIAVKKTKDGKTKTKFQVLTDVLGETKAKTSFKDHVVNFYNKNRGD